MNPMQQLYPDELERVQAAARQQLHDCWERAGLVEEWPATTETVVQLAQSSEYDVDPNRIGEYLKRGYIPWPRKEAGELRWDPFEVITLLNALERRRCWKLGSKLHYWKLCPAEIEVNVLRAGGREEELVEMLRQFSTEDLIMHLVESSHPWVRQAMGLALKLKLKNAPALTADD